MQTKRPALVRDGGKVGLFFVRVKLLFALGGKRGITGDDIKSNFAHGGINLKVCCSLQPGGWASSASFGSYFSFPA